MMVAGVDGCRAGWLVAVARDDTVELSIATSIVDVIARFRSGELTAVAIDMPIGLPDGGPRACDVEVRRRLGPRRSSVFPTPARCTLDAGDYVDACERSFAVCGRRLSKQAFHLLPRIADLDAAITPDDQRGVVEAHPELALARLHGQPMAHPKRTAAGHAERLEVLRSAGLALPERRPMGAGRDDVVDAVALTTVARRVAEGVAERVGDATRDARGLRMEIVV
jgi:predicted RNase H-like nuclease